MIPKKNRLNTKEIGLLFNRGGAEEKGSKERRVFHSPSLLVVCQRAREFKAGVVVQKKAYRNAVERNRLRRIVYQTLEHLAPNSPPFYVLFVVKKPIEKSGDDSLKKEVENIFQKLSQVSIKQKTNPVVSR